MAFCKYCGNKLEDGEICACQKDGMESVKDSLPIEKVTAESKKDEDITYQAKSKDCEKLGFLDEIKNYVVSYWNNPEDTIRSNMENNSWRLTVIHLLVRAIMVAFVVYKGVEVMTEDVKDYLIKALQDTEGEVSDLLGVFAAKFGSIASIIEDLISYVGEEAIRSIDITFSSEDTIIYSAVFSVVLSGVFILALFCVAKIQKSRITFPMLVKASIANGLYVTGALILIAVISFLDAYTAMFLLLLLPMIAWPICGVMTAQIVCEYNTERKKSFQLLYIVCVLVVIVIVVYLAPTFLEKIYGGITFDFFGQTASVGDLLK